MAERSWVWISDFESRGAGKVSVLAIVEVIFAVTVFWGIYAWTGWYWHLLSSVIAAPFVLFRSDASVALAHRMWERW